MFQVFPRLIYKVNNHGCLRSVATASQIQQCGSDLEKTIFILKQKNENSSVKHLDVNAAIGVCMRAKQPDEAMKRGLSLLTFLKQETNFKPKAPSYFLLMQGLMKIGNHTSALNVWDEMITLGVDPDSQCFAQVILANGKLGFYNRAVLHIETMERRYGIKPNVACYSAAIAACGKNRQWEKAVELFETMKDQGIKPNVICYTATINACGQGGQFARGLELLHSMIESGMKPNVVTFNVAISGCAKAGQWKKALKLMELMEDKFKIQPNEYCFGAAISACARVGQWEDAVRLLVKMIHRKLEPTLICYSTTISACAKAGQWEKGLSVWDTMLAQGMQADLITFNAAIHSCGTHAEKALELLRMLQTQKGVEPDKVSYGTTMLACTKGGQPLKALLIFDEICQNNAEDKQDPKILIHVSIIRSLLRTLFESGLVDEALKLFDSLESHGYMFDLMCARICLHGCAEVGKWDKVGEIIELVALEIPQKSLTELSLPDIKMNNEGVTKKLEELLQTQRK